MRDSNLQLRKSYKTALDGITYNAAAVPVYYRKLPSNLNPDNYIIFGQITNNDTSTKYKNDTSTTIQVKIHTKNNVSNNGDAADVIAGEVLERIYPADHTQLDLSADDLQCVSTELAGDVTQDTITIGAEEFVDRILTFRHQIFQR